MIDLLWKTFVNFCEFEIQRQVNSITLLYILQSSTLLEKIFISFLAGVIKQTKIEKKMYRTDVPTTINRIIAVFYVLKLWNRREGTQAAGLKVFHLTIYVLFFSSVVLGACQTNEKDEFVLLSVASIITFVHIFRLWYILFKKAEIIVLINELSAHSTNDGEEFQQINNKLENWMIFAKYFILMCSGELLLISTFPLISGERNLVFSIAFPFDYKRSQIAFWIAHSINVLGCSYAVLCFLLSIIVWYLMVNGAITYEMLGNRLRNMHTATQNPKISKKMEQNLFIKSLIEGIETHLKVKKQNMCATGHTE